jgi:hypothetical protein
MQNESSSYSQQPALPLSWARQVQSKPIHPICKFKVNINLLRTIEVNVLGSKLRGRGCANNAKIKQLFL